MAYKADLVVEVTQYFYNGAPVSYKGINSNVTIKTTEIMRITFTGKNMAATLDAIMDYRRGEYFACDMSIAASEFGINIDDKVHQIVRVYNERTPKN